MKILLLYPEFPDTFWSLKHALKFIRKKAASPPLGLLTVAAMLPSNWSKRLVDLNVRDVTDADLKWADYAFVSAMMVQRESTLRLLRLCKSKGLKIVAGGPLFMDDPLEYEDVDHFVLNEGELTLPGFLEDLENGSAKRVYRSDQFADMKDTPVPMWELAEVNRYASMSVQYSRGCPYNCDFCNITALFGHLPRTKSPEQIVAELDALYALGWRRGIFFVDDNFIGNKRRLKEQLLPELSRWRRDKPRITFNTEVSINLVDDAELMDMMVNAGFDKVFIGIETPDESSLAECNKKQNRNRDLVEDVKKIHRAGLEVQGGFIVGFDNDTPSIFQRQIDFIQKSGIMTAMVGLLQAPPGTKLYARMEKEGRLTGRLEGDNVNGTTNIIPTMNPELLFEGYKDILAHIYSPEYYYKRLKTFLKDYKAPSINIPLKWGQVMAFVRSAVHLGILGKERIYYWKLLVWTQFRRPRLVPLAITLAIYGHHFRKVYEQHII